MDGRKMKAMLAGFLIIALCGCQSAPASVADQGKTGTVRGRSGGKTETPQGNASNGSAGQAEGNPPAAPNSGQAAGTPNAGRPAGQAGDRREESGSGPSAPPGGQAGKAVPERHEGQPAAVEAFFVDGKNAIQPVNGETGKEKIALITLDDAPAGESTGKILEVLDRYGVKAIWFVNGYYADKHRDLLKEIHDRGHLIGNHTWWHKNLKTLTPEEIRKEILSVNDLVEKVTGVRPVYFRPPYGVNTEAARRVIKEEKMQAMNWTWGSLDWELKTAEAIEKNVVEHIHNGATILFHDKAITAEALDGILKRLREKGYRFVLPTEVVGND